MSSNKGGGEFMSSIVDVDPVILPAHVIGFQIGSFLDRQSLNNLRLTSKEVDQSMNGMDIPWPHTKLQVGSKVLGAQSLAFSPNGRSLACRSRGGLIQIWDQIHGKQTEWTSRAPFCFGNLTFSPDGTYLACDGIANTIRMYEASTGEVSQIFRGHEGSITSIAFSTMDPNFLASGSTDATIRLWDIPTQTEQAVLQGNSGAIYSVSISPDGQLLASGGVDRIVRVWSLEKVAKNNPHNFCQNLEGHEMTIVEVEFCGQYLISASLDRTIRVWSRNRLRTEGDRRKRRIAPLSFFCQRVMSLDFEALTMRCLQQGRDSLIAVSLSNETIAVWTMDAITSVDNDGYLEGLDNSSSELATSTTTSDSLPIAMIPGKHFCLAQGIMAVTLGKDIQLLPSQHRKYGDDD